ncbi:hypothetical protein [Jeotgalibacillus aurantiacus]|uniref:hypothetical protein n=1 Tax=Jeotgalibacillus aurantiacus TaxID=2763266 RepID=UPI001D0B9C3C|nr:hypothetical protein [Jeotgalibacillus aurantiacus]
MIKKEWILLSFMSTALIASVCSVILILWTGQDHTNQLPEAEQEPAEALELEANQETEQPAEESGGEDQQTPVNTDEKPEQTDTKSDVPVRQNVDEETKVNEVYESEEKEESITQPLEPQIPEQPAVNMETSNVEDDNE